MTALDILTSTGNLYLARDRPFSKVLSHIIPINITLKVSGNQINHGNWSKHHHQLFAKQPRTYTHTLHLLNMDTKLIVHNTQNNTCIHAVIQE